jgi:chorismate mutase
MSFPTRTNCAACNRLLKFLMPPNNNSNSTSALSRQMQRLRRQVDQIDLKMLRLLQQRTKLSGRIGQMKRAHGALIYVPERERELVARLTHVGNGRLPAQAVAAIYREIMSSSRAAQGQAPIGLLAASAQVVRPAANARFGACDQFVPKETWAELAEGLQSGALSLVLLTGADLSKAVAAPRWRSNFPAGFAVVDDFAPVSETNVPLAERIFIVTLRAEGAPAKANRILILIECKSTPNAVKSLLYSMPDNVPTLHAELLNRRGWPALIRLVGDGPMVGTRALGSVLEAGKSAGIAISILGIYPGTEDYAG